MGYLIRPTPALTTCLDHVSQPRVRAGTWSTHVAKPDACSPAYLLTRALGGVSSRLVAGVTAAFAAPGAVLWRMRGDLGNDINGWMVSRSATVDEDGWRESSMGRVMGRECDGTVQLSSF